MTKMASMADITQTSLCSFSSGESPWLPIISSITYLIKSGIKSGIANLMIPMMISQRFETNTALQISCIFSHYPCIEPPEQTKRTIYFPHFFKIYAYKKPVGVQQAVCLTQIGQIAFVPNINKVGAERALPLPDPVDENVHVPL